MVRFFFAKYSSARFSTSGVVILFRHVLTGMCFSLGHYGHMKP